MATPNRSVNDLVCGTAALLLSSATAIGCFGCSEQPGTQLDGGASSGEPGVSPVGAPPEVGAPTFSPMPSGLRRLTAAQYSNSIRELFGEGLPGGAQLATIDSIRGSQEIGAANAVIQTQDAKELGRGGQAIAAAVFGDANRRALLGICSPASAADACVRSFFEGFMPRIFRRPVSATEVDGWLQLTSKLTTDLGSADKGFQCALGGLLQSPHFIYRPEYGEPDASKPGWLRYTAWEMASRLSFTLWDSTPDAELIEAAKSGGLHDVAVLRAQAQRLLSSDRAKMALTAFLQEYLQVNRVEGLQRDVKLFPEWSTGLASSMAREAELLLGSFFSSERDLNQLFTTKRSFIDQRLATFYGYTGTVPADGGFLEVEFPTSNLRGGLLSSAAWLTRHSAADHPSPMSRGHAVRERFLCQELKIPANLNELIAAEQQRQMAINAPPPDPTITVARAAANTRLAAPTCAGCHQLMDPIGLSLENFDAIGQYRQSEEGVTIDASGDLDGTAFMGIDGLEQLLAADPRVSRCIVENTYAHLAGRTVGDSEAPVLDGIAQKFEGTGRLLPILLEEIVTSDGFRYTRASDL